jgi:23S rRNA (adenine2503-C2)-methyltransferase
MPVNRKYPIEKLLEACRAFTGATGESITFEYVLLAGVNDGEDDMARLARIVRSLPSKLNLIPFNPVPGWLEYTATPREHVLALRDRLLKMGVPVSVRWSRGAAARAACGQLALLPPAPLPGAPARRASPRRRS